MHPMRIAIVGGGPGGYEAALVAAENGAEVTLVADEGLGGNSVLWDCVPSKALIVSAEAMGWTRSAHRLGIQHTAGSGERVRAEADMDAVMRRVETLAGDQSADVTKKVEAAGVRLVHGRGRLVDHQTVAVDDDGETTRLGADIVLVATGSRPRILPFFTPDGRRVFTARELFSLRERPERLVVVGSGATGLEYAQAFARFGGEVHLVSSREQVLPGQDPDAAAVVEEVCERWGMTIHRRRRATDLRTGDDGVRVRVGDDEWVEASHALFCVGQVPVTDGLGLEDVGVRLAEDGSVPVDGVSRTNVPTIYAAGDVTGGIMLASVAAMRGRNAMWHALGRAVAPLRTDAIAACIFTHPEVAVVGRGAEALAEAQVPAQTVTLPFAGNPRAKMEEHTDGFVRIHAMEGSGTVLGATVVAAQASDLISQLSVAVHNRLSVSQLAQAFSIYPSMGGSVQETARQLMSRS
ncbi:MAG: NAD(P)H-quinone dehydrogenase [Actinomycetota bacterium]|nr:NAD(P)H-quinone dehydrogenase [Actinomycetota bacterium]